MKRHIAIFLWLLLLPLSAGAQQQQAQTITVTGTVTDEQGVPMIGVSVTVRDVMRPPVVDQVQVKGDCDQDRQNEARE